MTEYKLLPVDLETHLGAFEKACKIARDFSDSVADAPDAAYWDKQLRTIARIKEQLSKPDPISPVAYTSQEQLDRAKKSPGDNLIMWGEPLPYHNDIPLYTSPPIPDRLTIQWVVNLLSNLISTRVKERGKSRAADEYIAATARYIVNQYNKAQGITKRLPVIKKADF